MIPKASNNAIPSSVRQLVLPANSAAYVAELTRDSVKARDFLVRAGILENASNKRRAEPKRTELRSVAA